MRGSHWRLYVNTMRTSRCKFCTCIYQQWLSAVEMCNAYALQTLMRIISPHTDIYTHSHTHTYKHTYIHTHACTHSQIHTYTNAVSGNRTGAMTVLLDYELNEYTMENFKSHTHTYTHTCAHTHTQTQWAATVLEPWLYCLTIMSWTSTQWRNIKHTHTNTVSGNRTGAMTVLLDYNGMNEYTMEDSRLEGELRCEMGRRILAHTNKAITLHIQSSHFAHTKELLCTYKSAILHIQSSHFAHTKQLLCTYKAVTLHIQSN